MIERWHRPLEAAIMCHSNREWSLSLSSVLIGLRTNVLDIGASPAEFVFGTTLRIPGEFVLLEDFVFKEIKTRSRVFLGDQARKKRTSVLRSDTPIMRTQLQGTSV